MSLPPSPLFFAHGGETRQGDSINDVDRKRGEGRGIRGDKGRKVMTNCSCRERKQRRKSRKSQPADSISSCPSGILEVRHSRGRICTIFLETFFYQNSLSYAHRRATRHRSAEQIASMECVTAVSNYHHLHPAISHPSQCKHQMEWLHKNAEHFAD